MKNRLLLICVFPVLLFCSRDKTNPFTPSGNGEGLFIYPAVLKTRGVPVGDSFDPDRAEISGKPVIRYGDILSYDTVGHILHLSIARDSLRLLDRFRTPFLATLDSVKMYGGWFYANFASTICNSVVIIADDFSVRDSDAVRISLGYPNERFFTGVDPRGNPAIIRRLMRDGKVK